jgi:hypothetical protein
MTLIHIDSHFGTALPEDGPVYPLGYICELEAGVSCTKEGRLAFVEDKAGFGTVSLFVRLGQDDEDADIEIQGIFWGSKEQPQELEGAVYNAAEDYVRIDWGGVEDAFHDNAATDWKRITGRGYRDFLRQTQGRAA